jgi:hypothetical protein
VIRRSCHLRETSVQRHGKETIPMTARFGGPDEGLLRQHKAFSYDRRFQDREFVEISL